MDDYAQQQSRQREMDLIKREMERKSLDTFRVFNPLEIPFRFMYNSYWNTVPAKGMKDMPRYLAVHYFKKIAEYMIGQMAVQKGSELLERRNKSGLPEFLNKYDENKAIWDNTPRVHDPDLMKDIGKVVIVGLVEEYGHEMPPADLQKPVKIDLRPIQDQIMDLYDNKRVDQASELETKWVDAKPVDLTGEVKTSTEPQNQPVNESSNDRSTWDAQKRKEFGEKMKQAREEAKNRREKLIEQEKKG